MARTIDLNSDLGESFGRWTLGDDAAMLPLVTSANVACGFHAGDPATLLRTCRDAVTHDVRIGAQVSYRDLAGFGRRFVDASRAELTADVVYQLGALRGVAGAVGGTVTYVKPHGALYNTAVEHREHADAVADAVADVDDTLVLLGLPGSELLRAGERRGLRTVTEAFADRAYTPGGRLVPRRDDGAVLTDPDQVAGRALRLAIDQVVTAVDGSTVPVAAESVCLHGDTEGAVALAAAVRHRLDEAGVAVAPFT